MVTEVIIPMMDQAGGDFVLGKWLKREGDVVRVGDVLCEIETSKANVEIPSDVNGVLRQILVPEGTTIPALTVIALIADVHEPLPTIDPFYRVKQPPPASRAARDMPSPAKSAGEGARTPLPSRYSTGEGQGAGVVASPRAKKLAAEYGIDLSALAGTGPDGRIVEDDVRKAINQK